MPCAVDVRREIERERERQRQRSVDLLHHRQHLLRLAIANCHTRWFNQILRRADCERLLHNFCRECEGLEAFLSDALVYEIGK